MELHPIYDAMGNYSGTEWVPVDNTPVHDPVGEAIVRASRAAGKDPLEAGKGSLKSILNIGPGLINLPIAGAKLATEGYLAIGNQFGLVPNDIYQTFRDSQPWQLHTWTPSNDAQRFGQYGTDATMAAAGGANAWSKAGKTSALRDAEQLSSYGANSSGDMVQMYRGTDRYLENANFNESGHILSDAANRAYVETGSLEKAYNHASETHQKWIDIFGNEASYVENHSALGLEISRANGGLERTFVSLTDNLAKAKKFANGGPVYGGMVPRSSILQQTLTTSGEREYLVRYGTNYLKPLGQ